MGRGEVWIEIERALEVRDRFIRTAFDERDKAQGDISPEVVRIEFRGPGRECSGFLHLRFDVSEIAEQQHPKGKHAVRGRIVRMRFDGTLENGN